MRHLLPAFLGVALLACAGCDEDRDAVKEGGDLVASSGDVLPGEAAPAGRRAETKGAAYSPNLTVSPGPTSPSAPVSGDASGRAVFDGDTRFNDEDGAPVVPGANPGAGTSPVVYTAPARKNTLSVKDPPAPPDDGAFEPRFIVRSAKAPVQADIDAADGSPKPAALSDANAAPLAAGANGCPAEMARVGGYCIDRHEAALKDWSPYKTLDPAKSYTAVSKAGQVPQGYISGEQAAQACANAGKRLCKAAEWEKACKGSAATTYPYGATFAPRACNEHDKQAGWVSTISRVWGAKLVWSSAQMNDPRINQLSDGLAAAGAFAQCVNDYGVFDMVGNLHEWIADPAGTFRGGYYADTYQNGDGCNYKTTAHDFKYHDYSTGFRCCADPK